MLCRLTGLGQIDIHRVQIMAQAGKYIRVAGQGVEDLLPDSVLGPPREALMNGLPLAPSVSFGTRQDLDPFGFYLQDRMMAKSTLFSLVPCLARLKSGNRIMRISCNTPCPTYQSPFLEDF